MEMINIQIPAPDFSFANLAKVTAKKVIQDDLNRTGLMYLENHNLTKHQELTVHLNSIFHDFATKEEQLVYLSEIITYLVEVDNKYKHELRHAPEHNYLKYKNQVAMAKRFFYKQATQIGYNFDTNAFNNEEVADLTQKIDKVLSELEVVKMGNQVLGEMIEDLKDDLSTLKSAYVLGKKTWKQKATGIVVSFVGKKGSEAA